MVFGVLNFLLREPTLAVSEDLGCQLGRGLRSVDRLYNGFDLFAPVVVRDPEDRGVDNLRMAEKHILDLCGIRFAPPEMIMSVLRSQRKRKPSSSRYPTSPTVKNLPMRFFSVFVLSL